MPKFTTKNARGRAKYQADIREVIAYCASLENRVDHRTRFNLHDLDERIWRLEKYTLEELKLPGNTQDRALWPSFTSNGPRTYWNAIRRATTSNSPRMRVALPGFPDAETEDILDYYNRMLAETSLHERFAYGLWHSVDEQRIRRGMLPFQDQLAWNLGIRGGAFIRPWLETDSRFPFQVPLWDPRTVVYERGPYGLEFVGRHYRTDFQTIASMYPDADLKNAGKDEEGNVEVFDCWWSELEGQREHIWNLTALAGGEALLEPYEHRNLDHIPVYMIRAFGPDVDGLADYRDVARSVETTWETIYTANRNIYPWINRIFTLYGLYLRQYAIGPWFAKGTGFTEQQLKDAIRPFGVIQSPNPNAVMGPLAPPEMAQEVKEFFNALQGMEQRGSVPFSIFGQISFELSGFAVNQLQGAASMVASPLAKQMAWAYRLATDELITQFRQRGSKVTIRGLDQRRQQFIEDIKRTDLRDKFYLEVDITPDLPTDRLQDAQVAQAWKQVGVDQMTILDEVLKVQDPRESMRRTIAWEALAAEMKQRQAVAAGVDRQAVREEVNETAGMLPQVASPETLGQTQQHEQFTPNPQNVPTEQLAAAGFAR